MIHDREQLDAQFERAERNFEMAREDDMSKAYCDACKEEIFDHSILTEDGWQFCNEDCEADFRNLELVSR
jgi:formylmethanofuran dehydrogenase subunit E